MSTPQGRELEQAVMAIRGGNRARAETLLKALLNRHPHHPGALHLLGVAARQGNDSTNAERYFRDSLAASAKQPSVLVDLGNLLRTTNRPTEAEACLVRATRIEPKLAPAWYALALVLRSSGRLDAAADSARRAAALEPQHAPAWELLAAIEQARGRLEAAISVCREGLGHVPKAPRLHYSLGQVLREDGVFDEAAAAYRNALACGFAAPELYPNLGEAEFEDGDVEAALATLTEGATRHPAHDGLQRMRARFHWESGAPGDPLDALWTAARAHPRQPGLWQALADFAQRLGRHDDVRRALDAAQTLGCPETAELGMLDAIDLACRGDYVSATARFERLLSAYPRHAGVALAFAEHLITVADPRRAERLCGDVLEGVPGSQLAWALRGTAWQLLEDPRERWLLDYDRMVIPVVVPPPAGSASVEAFFADVRRTLEARHAMRSHPIDQTLRGGTQTNGHLFRFKDPLLRALETQIRIAVASAIEHFPDERAHPFWGRRPRQAAAFGFAGAWSVRLSSQGFHTNHIHPEGWISSALYVALPDEVRDGADDAGCIQFGVPPVEMKLALFPRRVVRPAVGTLVLFPSYMWHGTIPFRSDTPRMTVAFDAVPAES